MKASKESAIATPVTLENIDFGNKSAIIDRTGERIIVCNNDISGELIALINSQHSYSSVVVNDSFEYSSEIWDQASYLEYEFQPPKKST